MEGDAVPGSGERRRLFLNDHGARDPQSPLHPQSPLPSLSAARRSISASRDGAEGDRLELRSVSPRESMGGRGADPVHTLETRGRVGVALSRPAACCPPVSAAAAAGESVRPRPSSAAGARRDVRRHNDGASVDHSCRPERPHTAPRRRSVSGPGADDRTTHQSFQRKLRMPEAHAERRRGYFAHLGSNAPGSPLHPSFDGVGTSPQGSPRRTLSPSSTLSASSLPAAAATSPRLDPPAPHRTGSLPSAPAHQDSQILGAGGRRPSSARYGPGIKRYWSNDGARQPGTSLHPRHEIPALAFGAGQPQDADVKEQSERKAPSAGTGPAYNKYWNDQGGRRPGSPLHPAHKTRHFPSPTRVPRTGADSINQTTAANAGNDVCSASAIEERAASPRINVFANWLGSMQPNSPLSPSSPRSATSLRERSATVSHNAVSDKDTTNPKWRERGYAVGHTIPGERRPGSPLNPASPRLSSRPNSLNQSREHLPGVGRGKGAFVKDDSNATSTHSIKAGPCSDCDEKVRNEKQDTSRSTTGIQSIGDRTSALVRTMVSSKISRRRDLYIVTESFQLTADCKDAHLREAWRIQEEDDAAKLWLEYIMPSFKGSVGRHLRRKSVSEQVHDHVNMQPRPPSAKRMKGKIQSHSKQRGTTGLWTRLVDSGWSTGLKISGSAEKTSVNLFDGGGETTAEATEKTMRSYAQKPPGSAYR
jgi:hypothetical protein